MYAVQARAYGGAGQVARVGQLLDPLRYGARLLLGVGQVVVHVAAAGSAEGRRFSKKKTEQYTLYVVHIG